MKLNIIILAAGEGTRMRSTLPKVLHPLGGRPMLAHVVETAGRLGSETLQVVYGHGGDRVRQAVTDSRIEWVHQAEQLGTGHAVQMAVTDIPDADTVLVLFGDVPLLRAETLHQLLHDKGSAALVLLTATLDDASGYGRIVRDGNGKITGIVEEKDADEELRRIREINTGIMAISAGPLKQWLAALDNRNAQQEYYLTDIVAMAVEQGVEVRSLEATDLFEIMGVNDRRQLATLEREHQARQATRLLAAGVTLMDPARIDIRGQVTCGCDSIIDVNVILEGEVELGTNVSIGANSVIRDSRVADGVTIRENCVIEHADVGPDCVIGPFARIRPETRLAQGVHIGNFVEIKKSSVASGSKINHLSYIGDSRVGSHVNIGAGTITCNYDGANKHETIIDDDVFVGSDTQLVAPVRIGRGATIGAGSTITSDVPEGELALSRTPQQTRPGWKRPRKKS